MSCGSVGAVRHRLTPRTARGLIERLGEKWTVPLLDALAERSHRFNDLVRRFDINPKILTERLRMLEHDGLVARTTWPTVVMHVQYELTPFGREFCRRLQTFEE